MRSPSTRWCTMPWGPRIILILGNCLITLENWQTAVSAKTNGRTCWTKMFELLIALAAMNMGTGLELDHPTKSSRGTNPDVIVTINGQRWAFLRAKC